MEYAILGGGALGLGAAYRLAQAGHPVMVFEQEPVAGGLAAGFRVGDTWLEKFYHHLFRTDTTIIKLIQELGLSERLEWSHPRTVCLIEGKFQQLDSPITLLKFSPLAIHERVRIAAVAAFLKLSSSGIFEGKTAEPWLERWMGKHSYEMVFQPLFLAKFGAMHDQIALPWFWARFHDRTTYLGYLRGGFQLLYERLVERISEAGGKVLLGTRVEKAAPRNDGRWEITTGKGSWTVDRVISTLPTRLTCRLIPALPDDYRQRYDWGQAYGAQCLILALNHQLTDSYWINPCDPGYPFTSLVEHTNYRPPSEYGGRHLIYLGNYRPMHDPLFKMSKEQIIEESSPYLKRINPAFNSTWITESWLFQAPFAQPIVTTEYREHIPPLRTPLQGLWVANMFQVYPHDRGQNYSFALADRLVRELLQGDHQGTP
ncbi:MAG TPA: NAD(P)/FAD-dependent oxidoreductase [Ktedonobacteraceae bacterium]|jgi:protoporphyrinogen oxidase|nr:NAD(P)/FAD-dependent oxidoreductase [Ktedonobacteraceae bacterium]